MDDETQALLQHIEMQKPDMVQQLITLANINSGSHNLEGLKKVRDQIKSHFDSFADVIEEHSFQELSIIDMHGQIQQQALAPALMIRKRVHQTKRILITGHMDTVYGTEHPVKECSFENHNVLKGPGVCDMKGGLIVIKTALDAFEKTTEANALGWDVIINADEEISSPLSSQFLVQRASQYQAAFVYEPALDSHGTFAKGRPGSAKVTLVAHGKSAHAGRAFHEGRNAICYLAEVILAIHALNHQRPGVTINVGKIAGGDALNQVPDLAVAKLDIRIKNSRDVLWVQNQLEKIHSNFKRIDYRLDIHIWFGRPVKKISSQTRRLFTAVQSIGRIHGLNLRWEDTGGCCDGNNLAEFGLPVLDTMGVRGGKIHTKDEFILIDSLVERAQLSAHVFWEFAKQEKLP